MPILARRAWTRSRGISPFHLSAASTVVVVSDVVAKGDNDDNDGDDELSSVGRPNCSTTNEADTVA